MKYDNVPVGNGILNFRDPRRIIAFQKLCNPENENITVRPKRRDPITDKFIIVSQKKGIVGYTAAKTPKLAIIVCACCNL